MGSADRWNGPEMYTASGPVCVSHIGKRSKHEDNFFMNGFYLTDEEQTHMTEGRSWMICDRSRPDVQLYAVSDGIGGHLSGEVASRICMNQLAQAYQALQKCGCVEEIADFLQNVITDINHLVCALGKKTPECKGMGATLVLIAIYGGNSVILNVGDSRAYSFSRGTLTQITKDHTEGQRMLDLGILSRRELSAFPSRKHLTRYMGCHQQGFVLRPDRYFPARKDGLILLCSDGISDSLSDRQIEDILKMEHDLEYAGQKLVCKAVSADHADNATVILIPLGR